MTPADLYYVRYNFLLLRGSGQEDICDMGLWMKGVGGAEYDDTELASIAVGAYNAWGANVVSGVWATNVKLDSVTASNYLPNGHTLHEQVYVPGTKWVGTDTGAALPWETSLCVSLYTYPRGAFEPQARQKRGRFYLPPMAAAMLDGSNSGFFRNDQFSGFLDTIVGFLGDAQQDQLGVAVGELAVFSRVAGASRKVIQVSADAKFDSQRRRQNREVAGHREIPFG